MPHDPHHVILHGDDGRRRVAIPWPIWDEVSRAVGVCPLTAADFDRAYACLTVASRTRVQRGC